MEFATSYVGLPEGMFHINALCATIGNWSLKGIEESD